MLVWAHIQKLYTETDVAESGHDFTKFSTISQWFQRLIHPALMQRPETKFTIFCRVKIEQQLSYPQ
ncbi:MAG: hypothetical protein HRU34_03385 [Richelia sp.]|nr:hypothetical protein [Richelia sp.]CDN13471.1 hypothetical protein RintRC_4408 [Richelia intracellularis]